MSQKPIEALLVETRKFKPSKEFKKNAIAKKKVYEEGKNSEAFWEKIAGELHWFKKWNKVLEWNPPWAKWFVNGKINVSYNCLDRHVATAKKTKAAIIWEGEPGDEKVLTYWDLYREVNKFANVLRKLGVKRGDRVTIYLPMIPELPIAMLACTRIGAPHTIVFGGFSPESLRDRINDAQAKVVVTADGGWRRGTIVPLKQNVDEAVKECPSISSVVVVRRIGEAAKISMQEQRDHWWHDLMKGSPLHCPPEQMDA